MSTEADVRDLRRRVERVEAWIKQRDATFGHEPREVRVCRDTSFHASNPRGKCGDPECTR